MATITPVYSDGLLLWKGKLVNPGYTSVSVQSTDHARSIDLDLTDKSGAHIFISIGRTLYSSFYIDYGSFIEVRRVVKDNNNVIVDHPSGFQHKVNTTFPYRRTITSAPAGFASVSVPDANLFPVGSYVYFEAPGDLTYNTFEVGKIIYSDNSTNLILDSPMQFDHSSHYIYSSADIVPPIYVKGGAIYRICLTYPVYQQAEITQVIRVMAQTYNYDLSEGF